MANSVASVPSTTRRVFGQLVLVSSAVAYAAARDGKAVPVLLVRTAKVPAFEEAVLGIQTVLKAPDFALSACELEPGGGMDKLRTALASKPAAIVGVGSGAAEALISVEAEGAIFATMVLSPPSPNGRKLSSTVSLDVPHATVLARLKHLYPKRSRLAIVRGPALTAAGAARIEALARAQGYDIQLVDCPGPRELLDSFGALQGKADFAWTLPDNRLYQGSTVSAAILASIRHRVPVVGFSEGFVRAGALVGFYPDYHDIGQQTGEAVHRYLDGKQVSAVEHPRRVRVAVNERVMRLLGIQHAAGEGTVFVR